MRALVCSLADVASINIRDRLLETGKFTPEGEFSGHPVHRTDGAVMVTITERHLFVDDVDIKIEDELGLKVDEVVYLSKHKAASGIATLTVHPIGNYGKAEFGGRESTLTPSSPGLMTALLRRLKANVGALPFQTSFEATHHGPILTTPTLFIEIGSDERNWGNVDAARVLARSLLEVRVETYPAVVGVGGGHYAPRFSEAALAKKVSFGHMIPNYALDTMSDDRMAEALLEACAKSGTKNVYIHKKSMPRPRASRIREIAEAEGLVCIDSDDLEPLD